MELPVTRSGTQLNTQVGNITPKEFTFNDLILRPDSPKLPYERRQNQIKTAIHWGQRKLLISEIEFLTIHWDPKLIPNPICVYAGAAPGIHIPFLSKLFPQVTFHLYDPARFEIQSTNKILLFNEYFTDEVASRYAGRNDIFFVSDIRTTGHERKFRELLSRAGFTNFDNKGNPIGPQDQIKALQLQANQENEDQIWGDMNMQQQWVLIMNPEHALLKLRFPYSFDGSNKDLEYLKGIVYWQVWPGPTSTEARLKPVKNENGSYEMGKWSNLEYEQWGFYHNAIEREVNFYLNPFFNNTEPIDYPELLNDYDSVAEAFILSLYANSQGVTDPTEVYQRVKMLSGSITLSLNKNKTGNNAWTLSKKRKVGNVDRPLNRPQSPSTFNQQRSPRTTQQRSPGNTQQRTFPRNTQQQRSPRTIQQRSPGNIQQQQRSPRNTQQQRSPGNTQQRTFAGNMQPPTTGDYIHTQINIDRSWRNTPNNAQIPTNFPQLSQTMQTKF